MSGKVDVHTHAVPDFFREHLQVLEGAGVPIVDWCLEGTKAINAKLGVSTSILSLSAPGPEIKDSQEAVPSPLDVDGCLEEISYALHELQADGVCLFTSYGGKDLGDESFQPMWEELDKRRAVTFIHPIQPKGYTPINPMLQPPAFDFPHETGRTAAHLVMTGTKRRSPNVNIILSHAGGTLPYLAERLAQLDATLFRKSLEEESPPTAEEILADSKPFYFDLALSGTHNILNLLLKWAPGRVLYGSDFPYCTSEAEWNTNKLRDYGTSTEARRQIERGTAEQLFPRLR